MNVRKALLIIAVLALAPVIPYALFGYSGHDFLFHVSSWMEIRDAWRAGHPTPSWAAKANFTLGDPRFCFYPPVAPRFGALLALLLPFPLVPAVFIWVAAAVSGVCMYRAAGSFVAAGYRLPAALLYMLSPYLITSALIRFAAAELLVQAWLPLILMWFYQALWGRDARQSRRAVLWLSCLLGLSWLTDIPESIVLLYTLLATAGVCAWQQRSLRPIFATLLAEMLAGSLALFHLLPVWLERKWINKQDLVRIGTLRFLLFIPSNFTGPQPLKHFKWSCWLFACAGIVLVLTCLWRRSQRLGDDRASQTWVGLAAIAFYFQTPFSLMLWQALPQLHSAEFPFRFLPMEAFALPLVLFSPGTRPGLRKPICILLALLSTVPFIENLQSRQNAESHGLRQAEAEWELHGYRGVPEYIPAGQTWHAQASEPAPASTVIPRSGSYCRLVAERLAQAFTTVSDAPCEIHLALYAYPYWQALNETGQPMATTTATDGMLVVTMPAGTHTASLIFHPASAVRTVSSIISLMAVLLVALALALTARRRNI